MAAVEFIRTRVIRMGTDEFDKFFCKQFPDVTRYVMFSTDDEDDENEELVSNT